jgi:hypothetical protein
MCTVSIPWIVLHAPSKVRYSWLARTRRLMERWFCSAMLFRYCTGLHRHRWPSSRLTLSSAMTLGYEGFPSTLITRGRGCPGVRKAFRKNCLAAMASRFGERKKSMLFPSESTVRYKSTYRRRADKSHPLARSRWSVEAHGDSAGSVLGGSAGPVSKS